MPQSPGPSSSVPEIDAILVTIDGTKYEIEDREYLPSGANPAEYGNLHDKAFKDEFIYEITGPEGSARFLARLDNEAPISRLTNTPTLHYMAEGTELATKNVSLLWRAVDEEATANMNYGGVEFETGYYWDDEWRIVAHQASPKLERLQETLERKTDKIVGKDGVINEEELNKIGEMQGQMIERLRKNTYDTRIDTRFNDDGQAIIVFKVSPPVNNVVPTITDENGDMYANEAIRAEITEKVQKCFKYPYSEQSIAKGMQKVQKLFGRNKNIEHIARLTAEFTGNPADQPYLNEGNELIIPLTVRPQYLKMDVQYVVCDKNENPTDKNGHFNPANKGIKIHYPINEKNIARAKAEIMEFLNEGKLDGKFYFVQEEPEDHRNLTDTTYHRNLMLLPMPTRIDLMADVKPGDRRFDHWFRNKAIDLKDKPRYTNKSIERGTKKMMDYYNNQEGYILKPGWTGTYDRQTGEPLFLPFDFSYDHGKIVIGKPNGVTTEGEPMLTNISCARVTDIQFSFYGDSPAETEEIRKLFEKDGGKALFEKRLPFEGRYYKHSEVTDAILAIGNQVTGHSTLPDWYVDHNPHDPDHDQKSLIDSDGNFPVQIMWDFEEDENNPGDMIIKVKLAKEGFPMRIEYGVNGDALGAAPYVGATTRFMNGHNLFTGVGVTGVPLAPSMVGNTSLNGEIAYTIPFLNESGTSLSLYTGGMFGLGSNGYRSAKFGFEFDQPIGGPYSDWSVGIGPELEGLISSKDLLLRPASFSITYNHNTNTIVQLKTGPVFSLLGNGFGWEAEVSATHRRNLIPNGKLYFKGQAMARVRIGYQPSDLLSTIFMPINSAIPVHAYASAVGGVFYEVIPNQLGVGLGVGATTMNGWTGAPAAGAGFVFDTSDNIILAGAGVDAITGFAPVIIQ